MERCSNMELVAEVGPFRDIGIYWCKYCGSLQVEGETEKPQIDRPAIIADAFTTCEDMGG